MVRRMSPPSFVVPISAVHRFNALHRPLLLVDGEYDDGRGHGSRNTPSPSCGSPVLGIMRDSARAMLRLQVGPVHFARHHPWSRTVDHA